MSSEGRACRLFTLEDIQTATKKFKSVIGRGGYGYVYLGDIDDKKVAIKRLNFRSKQGKDEFHAEIKILSEVQHRNLISLIGYCEEEAEMILVYEYMPRGSLHDNLYSDGPLPWELRLQICIDAANGLYYLHQGSRSSRRILHGDIKSANILLDENFEAKISDFGLSTAVPADTGCSWVEHTTLRFTPGYVDPNYCATRKLTKECDVYSFGMVLLEVLCGKKAFDLQAQAHIKEGMLDGNIEPSLVGQVAEEYLLEFASIALKCIKKRPELIDVLTALHKLNRLVNPIWEAQDTSAIRREFSIDNGLGYDMTETEEHLEIPKIVESSANLSRSNNKVRFALLDKFSAAFIWKKRSTGTQSTANIGSRLLNLRLVIPFDDVLNATNHFAKSLLIGQDGFWKIYKGTLPSGVKVAVKRAPSQDGHDEGFLDFEEEIIFLSKIRHRHLVSFIGYCKKKSEMILVYEFMEKGSLSQHLYKLKNQPNISSPERGLSWIRRLKICIDAANGLHYLHTGCDEGITHRDVKSSNILIDENEVAKVTGFGLSRSDGLNNSTKIQGSLGYLDPEYFRTLKSTQKSDVYSFGVVLLEVLCARPALEFQHSVREEVNLAEWGILWQTKGQLEKIIDPFLEGKINTNSLRKFGETVEKCLKVNSMERPRMIDVLLELEHCLQLQEISVSRDLHEDSKTDASWQLSPPRIPTAEEELSGGTNDISDSTCTIGSRVSY